MSDEHPPPFHGFGLSLVSSGIAHFNYTVQNYAYDHRGRMARKDISRGAAEPQSIFYTWDNWNIIRETHVSRLASRVTHNVWGLDLDGTLQGAGGVGSLLAVARDDGVFLPAYDANGNITEYIATNGEVVAHYDYSPFGETLVASGPLASTFTHRFSTKPWCADTGLVEYQMRKYRPDIGRWMSRDPIGELGGLNLSGYCGNGLTCYDFLGLEGECKCGECELKLLSFEPLSPELRINSFSGDTIFTTDIAGLIGDKFSDYLKDRILDSLGRVSAEIIQAIREALPMNPKLIVGLTSSIGKYIYPQVRSNVKAQYSIRRCSGLFNLPLCCKWSDWEEQSTKVSGDWDGTYWNSERNTDLDYAVLIGTPTGNLEKNFDQGSFHERLALYCDSNYCHRCFRSNSHFCRMRFGVFSQT